MLRRVRWAVEVAGILWEAVPRRRRLPLNDLTTTIVENPAEDERRARYHGSRQLGR